jgi:ribulose-5-phosphate 4-epimerase/fuculose-1-phosphate aldolase
MTEQASRQQLLDTSQRLIELGLNRGTAGNASVRHGDGMLITPSALPVSEMTTESMVRMDLQGNVLQGGKPSSEWRFHRDILGARPEINAVIHVHSMFATTIACLRRDVPAVHYMIAMAGGDNIRCTPYSVFGEQELSDHAQPRHDRAGHGPDGRAGGDGRSRVHLRTLLAHFASRRAAHPHLAAHARRETEVRRVQETQLDACL